MEHGHHDSAPAVSHFCPVDTDDPSRLAFRSMLPIPFFRFAVAVLAIAANLLATGTPLLHAALHDAHAEDTLVVAGADRVDHDHAEVHPPSLHDGAVLLRGTTADFVFVAPAPVARLNPLSATERLIVRPLVCGWTSRAPPPGNPARAPPLI